jgi:hypothetical protein
LRAVLGRLRARKEEWTQVVLVLERRAHFDAGVWALGLVHGDLARAALSLRARFGAEVGPVLLCALLRVQDGDAADVQGAAAAGVEEVARIVNARAHPMGDASARALCNARLQDNYSRLLRRLAYQAQASDQDRLEAGLFLAVQGRVDEARAVLAGARAGFGGMQREYLEAFLALSCLDVGEAELLAAHDAATRHAKFPLRAWRDRWAEVRRTAGVLLGQPLPDPGAPEPPLSAQAPMEMELSVVDARIVMSSKNVRQQRVQVNLFQTHVELMFSSRPFAQAQEELGALGLVEPNAVLQVDVFGDGDLEVPLPDPFKDKTVLCQVVGEGFAPRSVTRYASGLKVAVLESVGRLVVTRALDGQRVKGAYVKVYWRGGSKQGLGQFFKDGYTSLLGEFDFMTLNTRQLEQASEFAVFVDGGALGCAVRRVGVR